MKNAEKRHQKTQKQDDMPTLSPPIAAPEFEIVADEEDTSVYVKISGFTQFNDCVEYADWLATYLPLLLYSTEVVH
jgi:hypothetical protein